MANEKKSGVSIVSVLTLVGLAAIGVFTFYGSLLHSSDGKPAGAILWAVVLVTMLGFFIYMSIKAKQQTDNLEKWKIAEYCFLAIYLFIAFVSAGSFNRFFYIISEKESMQQQANLEIKAIKTLYQNYEYQQRKYLDDATEQLQNYIASGQQNTSTKDALSDYVKGIGPNIESWATKAVAVVKLSEDKELKEISSRVAGWNLFDLASLATDLERKDKQAWTSLEYKITQYGDVNKLIPVIAGGGTTSYYLDGYAKFDLGTPAEPKFASMLRSANGSTIFGWFLYIVCNLLILVNYLSARRTYYVGPKRGGTNIGGAEL